MKVTFPRHTQDAVSYSKKIVSERVASEPDKFKDVMFSVLKILLNNFNVLIELVCKYRQ